MISQAQCRNYEYMNFRFCGDTAKSITVLMQHATILDSTNSVSELQRQDHSRTPWLTAKLNAELTQLATSIDSIDAISEL